MNLVNLVKVSYSGFFYFLKIKSMFPLVSCNDFLRAICAINRVQREMIGRHCGDMGDKLLQYLSVVSFSRSSLVRPVDSIEIGTLFGGSCIMKLLALRSCKVAGHVVCIDPMAGYYDKQVDPVSGLPVIAENLLMNLEKFGFSNDKIELRQMLSTDVLADEGFHEGTFATLLIDGDHSYNGVIQDWRRFGRFVCSGGYVLFDDYSDPAWPDLTKAVDAILLDLDQHWVKCGQIGTTYVIKRWD